jgi:DNA-3-methyladenine glycosylase
MFGIPGLAYVYFIYGMYEMLNFVTEPQGFPGAVLIRAVEPIHGEEWMFQNRPCKTRSELTNGPGKLCRAMGIEMKHNGQSLQGPIFYVADDQVRPLSISRSERVGIRLGKDKLWRFFVTGNPFVSRAPQNLRSTLVF